MWFLLFVLVFYMAVFVWPTAWRYHQVGKTPMRTNRVTGQVEYLNLQGWQPVLPALDVKRPMAPLRPTPLPVADDAGPTPGERPAQ